jgi:hypothetical protein
MLRFRLLEFGEPEASPARDAPPHPGAGNPQQPAVSPQEGAVEGKGREHHHQEEKGTEKKRTRTERAREVSTTEDLRASASAAAASPQNGDDADENPSVEYASPEDELKAIYQAKAGEPITTELLHAIRANLELSRVNLGDFVVAVRKHSQNKWRNPPGFLRDFSGRFSAKTRQSSAPLTAAEVIAKNYQCSVCHSKTPGEGAVLIDDKWIPCTCANPEYIARQRERGVFEPEPTP